MAWQGIRLVYQNIYGCNTSAHFPACSHRGKQPERRGSICSSRPDRALGFAPFGQALYRWLATRSRRLCRLLVLTPVHLKHVGTQVHLCLYLPPGETNYILVAVFIVGQISTLISSRVIFCAKTKRTGTRSQRREAYLLYKGFT